jgi:nucleoside-diphosphate-sugar epimerase
MSADNGPLTLVTGGAGYLGVPVVDELLSAGRSVRVLDVLLHAQQELATELELRGVEVIRGDIRDPAERRRALDGVDAVVHLAAIVGDPACARDPEGSQTVNVDGTRALVDDAAVRGVERIVFASTCSNYGRMRDPSFPSDEDGALAPVSLYARQKVDVERWLLSLPAPVPAPTCLRFATIYGVAPRMRFDLTVNEFTRELWAA